ncbi:MAG: hypothetical protein K2X77_05470 [Candidatus Obscuribacterales bacterium]|nr:hypothetical protein [Candidatus Obscuribacterales bacterium]
MHDNFSKLVIATVIAGSIGSSAQFVAADELVEFRRTTTIDGPTAQTTTVETRSVTVEPTVPVVPAVVVPGTPAVVTTTTAIPIAPADASLVLQTIEARRGDIEKRIAVLRPAGTLTDAQIALYAADLDRINKEILVLRGTSTPSLSRALSLAKDLDLLAIRLGTFQPAQLAYVPIIEGSHFTIFNGRIVLLDDLAVRRVGLESKITDRLYAGAISAGQAAELRTDLVNIAAAEDAWRTNGQLTPKEAKEIYTAFDKVANKLDDYSGTR